MSNESDKVQELSSRIGGLHEALQETLDRLIEWRGKEARQDIEALRDSLVMRFKNSGIPAERELDHAKIADPASDVIETAFNAALAKLPRALN